MREITFWFNYNSPYSMLAYYRLDAVLHGLDVTVRQRPWFAGVRLPDYDSAKVHYVVEDVIRHARARGLVLRPGAYVDLGAACRGFLLARACGCERTYQAAIHRARWLEGRDISESVELRAIAAACGLEQAAFDEALEGARWAAAFESEMAEGRAAGVFGVPFFEYAGQRFWGNDRLDWLVAAVRGEDAPSEACVMPSRG